MSTFKDLGIPSSQSTVIVKAIDVGVPSTRLPAAYFIEPVFPGYETFSGPIYAFLIEHTLTGKRLMFDLGMRKDQESFPPVIQQLLALWKPLGFERAEKDVFDKLQEGGVDPATINTVIWSHSHVDHSGIAARFPGSTELVIGPGTDTHTFPNTPDSPLLESDFVGRKVTELSLNDFVITIGDCEAMDYFSDASTGTHNSPCPCHSNVVRILESLGDLSISSRTAPLLSVSPGRSAYADQETSLATIAKLSRLDANPDVLVLIAHDSTAPGVIDEFPKSLNDWKAKGWKDKLMWAFLEKDSPAFRFG